MIVDTLEVLAEHAPAMRLDIVLADPGVVDDERQLRAVARGMGAELVLESVAQPDDAGKHDILRLAAAYRDILGTPND